MKLIIQKLLVLLTAGALALAASAAQSQLPFEPSSSYNFRVLLDDKPIGFHQFELSQQDSAKRVSSTAKFDVKLFFITAFKYRHTSSERWQDNCLTRLEAQTNSNGKQQAVSAERIDDELRIDGSGGTKSVGGCVQTFAYWNPGILDASRLLNSQTGDYVDVDVVALGKETLALGDATFEARKYKIQSTPEYDGKPVEITLWYEAGTMQWLALESPTDTNSDRTIRYERTDPAPPAEMSLSASGATAAR